MMIFSLPMTSTGHFYFVQESRSLRSLKLKWQKLCQFLHFLQFSALASHWHKTNVLCQIMTKLIAESVALNNRNVKLMDVAGNLSKIIQPIYLGNYIPLCGQILVEVAFEYSHFWDSTRYFNKLDINCDIEGSGILLPKLF